MDPYNNSKPGGITSRIIHFFNISLRYRLAGLWVLIRNKPVKFETYLINFPPSKLAEYGSYFFNDYEKEERFLIKKYLKPNSTVLEMGGCTGVVSNLINSLLEDKSKQVVLEPNPKMIPYLTKNKEINSAGFKILNTLISEKKEIVFNVYKKFLGSSVHERDTGKVPEKVSIKCTTVEQIENDLGLKFDVLVMDIEGNEIEVLKMTDLDSVKLLIIEFHEDILGVIGHEEFTNLLKNNGFEYQETQGKVECWMKPGYL